MAQIGRPRGTDACLLRERRHAFLAALHATLDLEAARLAAGMTEASAWRIVRALGVEGLAALHNATEAQAA